MSNFLANTFQAIAKALGSVQSLETAALEDLGLVANGVTSYEAGLPVVLSTMSADGHAGKIVALMNGGSASKSLGLSQSAS